MPSQPIVPYTVTIKYTEGAPQSNLENYQSTYNDAMASYKPYKDKMDKMISGELPYEDDFAELMSVVSSLEYLATIGLNELTAMYTNMKKVKE